MNAAVEDAYREYGAKQEQRAWNVFMNGTDEERRALQDEIHREIASADSKDGGLATSKVPEDDGGAGAVE